MKSVKFSLSRIRSNYRLHIITNYIIILRIIRLFSPYYYLNNLQTTKSNFDINVHKFTENYPNEIPP